ncbi:hypothetical protein T265_06915 [Opisthorchis viverrini]|uniref:Uncharacterized protein n=1 Tax=Opisthorchis viverrini TaxID=6198 RepID=A0A074ZQS6_OPIVI|nr:hypothetical protein T265_06915 [Opisthorchis viverrini]KER25680.1 hypothetical protein T265_06915 [Opisthorchis viverrini]
MNSGVFMTFSRLPYCFTDDEIEKKWRNWISLSGSFWKDHHTLTRPEVTRFQLSRCQFAAYEQSKCFTDESGVKAGNAQRLFQLIRAAGPRKPPVSETIKHQNGTTISNKEERLDRFISLLHPTEMKENCLDHSEPFSKLNASPLSVLVLMAAVPMSSDVHQAPMHESPSQL